MVDIHSAGVRLPQPVCIAAVLAHEIGVVSCRGTAVQRDLHPVGVDHRQEQDLPTAQSAFERDSAQRHPAFEREAHLFAQAQGA